MCALYHQLTPLQFDMNVGYDCGLDRVFVIWPITVCHEIDASSPLYDVSKESLKSARFEIIAILEGVVESVGPYAMPHRSRAHSGGQHHASAHLLHAT